MQAFLSAAENFRAERHQLEFQTARVVKLVDTGDLKSPDLNRSCRFESGPGHQADVRGSGKKNPPKRVRALTGGQRQSNGGNVTYQPANPRANVSAIMLAASLRRNELAPLQLCSRSRL